MTLPTDGQWTTIEARDRAARVEFVFGVKTTGVFCRPGCPARMPKRENVRVFAVPAMAEAAGYRACKRCAPFAAKWQDPRAELVQSVCAYIAEQVENPDALTLEALSAHVHYDPSSLQDAFRAVLGMTSREYAEAVRMRAFKDKLQKGETVTNALYSAGYGSSSRVYERIDNHLGMTPATYRKGGLGMEIRYATGETPFGVLMVAVTPRGICRVSLHGDEAEAAAALCDEFPQATIAPATDDLGGLVGRIVAHVQHGTPIGDVAFDIQATAFQWRVWNELRRIPRGETRTYSQVAEALGEPKAVRAVASACANNHAAVVIPCHRVVGKDGSLTGYRWGVARKAALLKEEARA